MPADGTLPTTTTAIHHIDPALIDPSPTQPRKTFDAAQLAELASDIKTHGVIHPITVRARGKRFELVVGERRTRACKSIGVKVPAFVRDDLDDATVLEWQLTENGTRSDVHPLEEAEGYEILHSKHKRSVDEIAAKLGKSKAHVYARLKLCALIPEARKAFRDGLLSASSALYVARVPQQLQKQALEELEPYADDEPLGARESFDRIERKFMLRLAEAPFDRGDATLVAKAGACTTCPKRTGNQKELFADVKSADVCTDPTCFSTKRDAAWTKKKAEAEKAGQTVIEGPKADRLLPYQSSKPAGFVRLDEKNYDDAKQRTNREILAAKKVELPPTTLVRTADGKVHELVPEKVAAKAIPKDRLAGVAGYQPKPTTPEEKAKAKLEDAIGKAAELAIVTAIVAKAGTAKARVTVLRMAADMLLGSSMAHEEISKRRGITVEQLEKLPDTAKEADLLVLLAECAAWDSTEGTAKALGVDAKTLRAKAAAAVKDEAKKKATKPAKVSK